MGVGYYAAMASAAAVAALLAAIAGFAADHRALLPDLLARVAVSWARRISALPAASGLWVGALAAAAMLGHSAAVHGSWGALLQSSPRVLAGTLLHLAGFGVYLGLYAYFVTLDYSMRLRERLWRAGGAHALIRTADPSQRGSVQAVTRYRIIIPSSACSRLWQWNT